MATGYGVRPEDLRAAAGRLRPVRDDAEAMIRQIEQVRGSLTEDAFGDLPRVSAAVAQAFAAALSGVERDVTAFAATTDRLAEQLDGAATAYTDADAEAAAGYGRLTRDGGSEVPPEGSPGAGTAGAR